MVQRILVAQRGARMHYAVPKILDEAGILEMLHTDVLDAVSGKDVVRWLLPTAKARRRYSGRAVSDSIRQKTIEHRLTGLAWMALLKLARTERHRRGVFHLEGAAFARRVARYGFGAATHVYSFTNSSLELFEAARRRGLHCILEQFVASQRYRDQTLAEEREAYRDWDRDQVSLHQNKILHDRVRREWDVADTIICPSEFVRESLISEGVSDGKLVVVPYGVADPGAATIKVPSQIEGSRALRVLFAGTIELRKGVHTLYDALRRLGTGFAEVRFVGPLRISESAAARLASVGKVIGQVPRLAMGEHFRWADVLVLPSLVEGSATVTYEALVRGIPVVCTPNSGSIVEHGRNGLLVTPRDSDHLANTLRRLVDDRQMVRQLADNAIRSREEASLTRYSGDLLEAIKRLNVKPHAVVH